MLEHLEAQSKNLEARGLVTSYIKSEDEAVLCWYNENDERNSIYIWAGDNEGVWASSKDGKVISRKDFNSLSEFLEFSL